MKRIVLSVAASALMAGVAFAAEPAAPAADPMAGAYENTLVAKNAQGQEARVWYNADGTYTSKTFDGSDVKGTWVSKEDGSVCLTRTEPAPKEGETAELCGPPQADSRKPGDTWDITASDGQVYTLTIVEGRQ